MSSCLKISKRSCALVLTRNATGSGCRKECVNLDHSCSSARDWRLAESQSQSSNSERPKACREDNVRITTEQLLPYYDYRKTVDKYQSILIRYLEREKNGPYMAINLIPFFDAYHLARKDMSKNCHDLPMRL